MKLRQVFREKGKLYLVFDYEPRNLLEELQSQPEQKGIDASKIRKLVYQMLMSVKFLHENKIMHRDIKPENLLISKAGLVKMCDFGFARGIRDNRNF